MTRGRKPDDYYLHEGRKVPVFWPHWSDIEGLSEIDVATAVDDTDLLVIRHNGVYQAITFDNLKTALGL